MVDLNTEIAELGFSSPYRRTRCVTALKNDGITTVGDLVEKFGTEFWSTKTPENTRLRTLCKIPNLGTKTVTELVRLVGNQPQFRIAI